MVRLASTRAINEEEQDKEDAPFTREAQMSELIRKYESSLKILNSETPLAAREMFYELLEHPIVHQARKPQARKGRANKSGPPQDQRLLYLVLKHLADVEVAYVEEALAQGRTCDPQKPLALYADALNMDASDVQLWLRFGRAAVTAEAPAVARVAFEHGLQRHPHHPLLSDELLQVLIKIGDTDSAKAVAQTIASIDPTNSLAQQLICITAVSPQATLPLSSLERLV